MVEEFHIWQFKTNVIQQLGICKLESFLEKKNIDYNEKYSKLNSTRIKLKESMDNK